jgi:hypothetical protein
MCLANFRLCLRHEVAEPRLGNSRTGRRWGADSFPDSTQIRHLTLALSPIEAEGDGKSTSVVISQFSPNAGLQYS